MRAAALLLIVATTVAVHVRAAAAAPARLGVIDLPPEVDRAVRVALAPWGLQVVALDDPAPAGEPTSLPRAAAAIAAQGDAAALLWIAGDGDATTLWIFEAATGELSIRPIADLDDPATAAAIGLIAKTMLRATALAPDGERLVLPAEAAANPGQLRVHAGAMVRRLDAGPTEATEARLGVALSYWPRALGDRVGVTVGVWSGPGIAVEDDALLGRLTDTMYSASARGRWWLSPRVAVGGAVGLTLHRTSLDGFSPVHGIAVDVERTNAALDTALAATIKLGGQARLGVALGLSAALRRQRYLLAGTAILELPAVEPWAALELEVAIP